MRVSTTLVSAAVLVQLGCAAPPPITPVFLRRDLPIAAGSLVIVSNTALEVGPTYTGLAVEPGGRRLVLSQAGAVTDLRTGDVVWDARGTTGVGLTDLAAIDDGRLAVTGMSDGFLLELGSGEIRQHFCYEPGWMEPLPNDPVQVSFAVAVSPGDHRIYAQPITIENFGSGLVTGSYIAGYDLEGGADLSWWQLPSTEFQAGGLIALPGEGPTQLILGSGSVLYRFDTSTAELTPATELEGLGIARIGALALDPITGTLLVLDEASSHVLELSPSVLANLRHAEDA